MIDFAFVTDEVIRQDQYRYIQSHAWWMARFGTLARPYAYLGEHLSREWIPADSRRVWLLDREVTGRRIWLAGSAEQAAADGFEIRERWPAGRWRAPHGDYPGFVSRQPGKGSWQTPDNAFLIGLPRNPYRLLERLQDDSPSDRPGYIGALVYALDALRSGLIPADLRAGLYAALLLLPSTTFVEDALNLDGRPCATLAIDDSAHRTEVLINPGDGQFTGERSTLTRDASHGLKAGTVIKSAAITRAIADAAGDIPPLP